MLIDPPDSRHYDRGAKCRVNEFAPNNEERHLKNAEKDGTVLVMGMPRLDEILRMAPVLWREDTAPKGVSVTRQRTSTPVLSSTRAKLCSTISFANGSLPGLYYSQSRNKQFNCTRVIVRPIVQRGTSSLSQAAIYRTPFCSSQF